MYPVQLYQMRYAYTLICEYVEIFKSLKKKNNHIPITLMSPFMKSFFFLHVQQNFFDYI